jgi:hypothetical protein
MVADLLCANGGWDITKEFRGDGGGGPSEKKKQSTVVFGYHPTSD